MGQENTHKCVPNPFLTHDFHFLTQLELVGAFASHFFAFSFIFHGWISVFVLHSGWEGEIHDLGVYRGHFFPRKAHKHFLKSIFLSHVWFPIYHSIFWFPSTSTTNVLLLCASLFWYELGVEEDQNWIDKPSEERNLTKDRKGLATLLCTP